ncbi:alpha/beta hydrolase [Nocardia altamirensis]|uniref:alpha/beta hydrolase n=1 Tax=Nocardia altamirensis TaxID=472158 RepID=UPI000840835D|nr:alpha/beta hydrolase [Nocardia altamirensis]
MDHYRPARFVLAALAAVVAVLFLAPPAYPDTQQPQTISALTYATAGDTDLQLDLYLPATAGPHPLVIFLHGGAWVSFSRAGYPIPMPWGTVPGVAASLVERGYAVASVGYRLATVAPWPAQIHDVKAAVRWLRSNSATYGFDPDRFAALGESSGGHIAAVLGVSGDVAELEGTEGSLGVSSRVQAVVDWFGATDLLTLGPQSIPFSLPKNLPGSPEARLVDCVPTDCPDKARAASPVYYVTRDAPPFLIQHGELDHVVPFGQSVQLRDALVAAGVPTEFHSCPMTDHEFVGLASPGVVLQTVFDFLGTHLHPG